MVTSSLYLILTASVTMQSGLSLATAEAFAAIAIGGACGTIAGMLVVERLELGSTRKRPLSEGSLTSGQTAACGCHLGCDFEQDWRGWMGIEPTKDTSTAPFKRF